MALNPEWQRRSDNWKDVLWMPVYCLPGTLELEGCVTTDQLTADWAFRQPFHPFEIKTVRLKI